MNRHNFTVSINENLKRQEYLRSAIDGLNEITKSIVNNLSTASEDIRRGLLPFGG